jgi:hypothetical protein
MKKVKLESYLSSESVNSEEENIEVKKYQRELDEKNLKWEKRRVRFTIQPTGKFY